MTIGNHGGPLPEQFIRRISTTTASRLQPPSTLSLSQIASLIHRQTGMHWTAQKPRPSEQRLIPSSSPAPTWPSIARSRPDSTIHCRTTTRRVNTDSRRRLGVSIIHFGRQSLHRLPWSATTCFRFSLSRLS